MKVTPLFAQRRQSLVHSLWALPFLLVFSPTLLFLWEKWTKNVWLNGHGVFVPILVAFLAHFALTHRSFEDEEPSPWGFAFLGAGLFLVAYDSAIKTEILSAVALIVCLPGLSLLLLGPQRTRALLFPWLLSFFMLPLPAFALDRIHMALRLITVYGTAPVLDLFGIPHVVSGTTIEIPRGPVQVVDLCSGFSALYAATTIALVLIYMADTNRRRVILALLPFPLAMLFNIVRVTGMVLLCHYQGFQILDTWIHTFLGWVCFLGTLVVLFTFADDAAPSEVRA